jgi:L-rhamnonate dehydratase
MLASIAAALQQPDGQHHRYGTAEELRPTGGPGATGPTIKDVRAAQPVAADGSPLSDWGGRQGLGQICVAVDTDDGLVGYGVCGGGAPGILIVQDVLKPLLVGQPAADVEQLWEQMNTVVLPYGRKGLAVMALSGVDLALWDLRGKRAGKSVAALLNPSASMTELGRALPSYITMPTDAAAAVADGFRAIKLAIGHYSVRDDMDKIIELVRETRTAIGDEVELMADAAMGTKLELGWSDKQAVLQLCKALEPYRLSWLEEPLPCDELGDYAWLIAHSKVPIAAGEHESTHKGFAELLACNVKLAVWQPDIAWCGGMTPLVEIYRLSRKHGIRICPHRGSEVWSLHAMVALGADSASSPQLAESGRPWMDWVGEGLVSLEGGKARLLDLTKPGFGVTLPV